MKKFRLLITIFLAAQVFWSCEKELPLSSPGSGMEYDVLRLVNEYRSSKGLSTLRMEEVIRQEAATHSRNMASGTVAFSHDGFANRAARIRNALGGAGTVAENIAYGYTTAKAVVDGWIASPGHRANMEGNFNLTGIGIAKSAEGYYYFTQIFYRK